MFEEKNECSLLPKYRRTNERTRNEARPSMPGGSGISTKNLRITTWFSIFRPEMRENVERAKKSSKRQKNDVRKNLCSKRDFYTAHRQTQQVYSWIGLDLRKGQKLVRSQTTSRIMRYLHCSDRFTHIVRSSIEAKFPCAIVLL